MDQDSILPAIESELSAPSWRPFAPRLEHLYQLREGPERRSRMAFAVRCAAANIVTVSGLDLYDSGWSCFFLFLSYRVATAILCLAGACLLIRARSAWHETLCYAVPTMAIVFVTELLGEWSQGRFGDRYMLAAAFCGMVMISVPPVGIGTSRLVAVAGASLFALLPTLVPGHLPLAENWDLAMFACGAFALGSLLARRNVVRARTGFLHTLRHEISKNQLSALNAELLRASSTDWLTNLPNRRSFDRDLHALPQNLSLPGFGLALIDIDRFKAFNDSAGHEAGDACLRKVAGIITGTLRADERVARYGGEEFAVLVGCPQRDMASLGERLRLAVELAAIPHPGLEGAPVTISVGLAWHPRGAAEAVTDLVRQADQALYRAKHAGRNRVVMASNSNVQGQRDCQTAPVANQSCDQFTAA